MVWFFSKGASEDCLGDEGLRESVRLLFREVARRNGDPDIIEWPDNEQANYICTYIMMWFVRWAVFEKRQTQKVKLSRQELGSSFVVLDRLYLNISTRYGFDEDALAAAWDPTFANYIRLVISNDSPEKTNKQILEMQREELELAIGFIKNCERLTPGFLGELDNQIQNIVGEVIDVFLLSERENPTGAFRPLLGTWVKLTENFSELTDLK